MKRRDFLKGSTVAAAFTLPTKGLFVPQAPAIIKARGFPLPHGSVVQGLTDAMTVFLAGMAPNTWAQVPNTSILPSGAMTTAPCYNFDTAAADYNTTVANSILGSAGSGCVPVTGPYQGAAYDTVRNRMIVGMTGGHLSGYDNSLIAIDLNSLTVKRLTTPDYPNAPSPYGVITEQQSAYPNGDPMAQHTYAEFRFVPNWPDANGCLFVNGIAASSNCTTAIAPFNCSSGFYWAFSSETSLPSPGLNWQPPSGPNNGPNAGKSGWTQTSSAYVATPGYTFEIPGASPARVIVFSQSAAQFPTPAMIYNFATDNWSTCPNSYWAAGSNVMMQIRGSTPEVWCTGGYPAPDAPYTGLRKYDLPSGAKTDLTALGSDTFIRFSNTPAMAYHAASDKFICWGPAPSRSMTAYPGVSSPGNLFDIIDPTNNTITQKITGGITMPNDIANPTGGFGGSSGFGTKLIYDAIHNCVVLLTTVQENLYVYKPDNTFPI